jgi:hypothetical protein
VATTSSNQGAREVYGAIAARLETPNGDSAMDETNDAIRVNVVAGAAAGGTSATDGGAYTAGSTSGTPIMAVRDDAATGTLAEDKVGLVRQTTNRALHVNLRDATGAELSVGGGTQFNEDDPHTSGDKVTMAGIVRKDTAASLAGTDGDITIPTADASGRLWVNASGAAVPVTDNAGSLTVDGTVSITANSSVNVAQLAGTTTDTNSGVKSAGTLRVVIATDQPQLTNALKVDGSAVTQPVSGTVAVSSITTAVVPGTAATNLGKAEDAGHSSGDTGVFVLGVRNDAQTTLTSADADYSPMAVDGAGNGLTVGNLAHDAVDAGNPVKVGMRAIAHGTNPTAVAAADRTDWYANRAGIPFVLGGHPNVICREILIAAADGAQTDLSIAGTINSGTKVVVTKCSAMASAANTVNTAVRVGFGAANLGTAATTGVNGIILSHKALAPGSGVVEGGGSGIIGVGGDGEEVRLTCGAPTGGHITVLLTYFTIES